MGIELTTDFFEFLKLLNENLVEYAVGFHGYPRATGDMDIWIPRSAATAEKMVAVFAQFGFSDGVDARLFTRERLILRLGIPPNLLEVTTHIDGVEFDDCYQRRVMTVRGSGDPGNRAVGVPALR